jgi:hypothetical protein
MMRGDEILFNEWIYTIGGLAGRVTTSERTAARRNPLGVTISGWFFDYRSGFKTPLCVIGYIEKYTCSWGLLDLSGISTGDSNDTEVYYNYLIHNYKTREETSGSMKQETCNSYYIQHTQFTGTSV